jgi:hypothetical protein
MEKVVTMREDLSMKGLFLLFFYNFIRCASVKELPRQKGHKILCPYGRNDKWVIYCKGIPNISEYRNSGMTNQTISFISFFLLALRSE